MRPCSLISVLHTFDKLKKKILQSLFHIHFHNRIIPIIFHHIFSGNKLLYKYFKFLPMVACDQILLAMNNAFHENIVSNALVISLNINRMVKHCHFAWTNRLVPKIAVWERPSPLYYKINYDAAIHQDFSVQVAVCKNYRGTIISCFTIISSSCSSVFWKCDSLVVTLYLFRILISHKTGEFPLLYPIFYFIRQQQLASRVNRNVNFCTHM
jgi:hypothetical protein